MPMKRTFLFDIFVNKGLRIKFLLFKLNIAPFYNPKISVEHDKSYATNSSRLGMYIIACDVNTFAAFLWSAVNNGVCKGIYVAIRLRPLINCRINQGRTSNWKLFKSSFCTQYSSTGEIRPNLNADGIT